MDKRGPFPNDPPQAHTPIPYICAPHDDAPLLIADELEEFQTSGLRAQCSPIRIGHPDREFGAWMLAPHSTPLPALKPQSAFNCWEMIFYAGARRHLLDPDTFDDLMPWMDRSLPGPTWSRKLRDSLLPHTKQHFIPGDHSSPRPQRGDLMVWGDAEHVAMATGETVRGSPEVFSFWPHYADPARYPPEALVTYDDLTLRWTMPVQRVPVDELNSFWTEDGLSPPEILFGRGPW
ncbi:hypothetical protein ACFYO1_02560 [Nocardia sp. NPDC006044]|uniref:hypothetical protein n=1 Tax=Nocardia sp. NPDC006044 TaxID=3364306 RepID=UPI0036AE5EA1